MSKYNVEDLVRLWATEKLTPEQAMGQVLLHLRELLERIEKMERSLRSHPADPSQGIPRG
jgi:hypothetical protein